MAREDDIKALLAADTTLMAILTGGIYSAGTVGMLGITRDSAPSAFSGGWLLPVGLVRQAGRIPDGNVQDYDAQITSTNQRVEVWLYQESGSYAALDAAAARIYVLLQGHNFADSYEVYLANDIDRQRDEGALAGASLRRLDFIVPSIMGG